MPAMPTQPTLPFSDPPDPQPPSVASSPAPETVSVADAVDDTNPILRAAPSAGASGAPVQPELPIGSGAAVGAATRRPPWWVPLLGKLLEPWSGLTSEPPAPAQLIDGRPVCYVLEDYGLSNALVLERACRDAGLPSPLRPLPGAPLGRKRAYVALSRRNAGSTVSFAANLATGKPPPPPKRHSDSLARLLDAHRADPTLDVQLVPVSIFVGRAPDKNSGWFSVLFSENWTLVGRFRRLLAILLNGRNTLVRFAAPVSLRAVIDEALPPERTVRKVSRVERAPITRNRGAEKGTGQ